MANEDFIIQKGVLTKYTGAGGDVVIPDGVTEIGWWAFRDCTSLTAVTIPASVKIIAGSAFSRCSSIAEINVDPDNKNYCSIDGVVYTKDGTVLVLCPAGKTSVTIPDGVTKIGGGAFMSCSSLVEVAIPEGVKYIESSAFFGCSSLTSITIPNGVTKIQYDAFGSCTSLESVVIPSSVTEIGDSAFKWCSSLTEVDVPSGVTKIGREAFTDCTALTTVRISGRVEEIGGFAFGNCPLKKVVLGANVASVKGLFYPPVPYVVAASMPVGLSTIVSPKGRFVFKGSIADITVKDLKVKAIVEILKKNPDAPVPDEKEQALINDYIKKNIVYFIPQLEDSEVFAYVKENGILTAKNVEKLLAASPSPALVEALQTCAADTFAEAKEKAATNAATGNVPVSELKKLWKIRDVDDTSVEIYGYKGTAENVEIPATVGKKDVVSIGVSNKFGERFGDMRTLVIPYGVKRIATYAFQRCTTLAEVTIPDSVEEMGNCVFEQCIRLTSVRLPVGMQKLSIGTFAGCQSLASVVIPAGVTVIEDNAFNGCSALAEVSIPDGVTVIGCSAFSGCKSLTSVTIPAGVTEISNAAFCGCSALAEVSIPDGVTVFGYSAFARCAALTSIYIPAGVTKILDKAFEGCSSLSAIDVDPANAEYCSIDGVLYTKDVKTLVACPAGKTSVTVADGVTKIGTNAFWDCKALTTVTIPASVEAFGCYAFGACPKFTIKIQAPAGSAAEACAKRNDIPFEAI